MDREGGSLDGLCGRRTTTGTEAGRASWERVLARMDLIGGLMCLEMGLTQLGECLEVHERQYTEQLSRGGPRRPNG